MQQPDQKALTYVVCGATPSLQLAHGWWGWELEQLPPVNNSCNTCASWAEGQVWTFPRLSDITLGHVRERVGGVGEDKGVHCALRSPLHALSSLTEVWDDCAGESPAFGKLSPSAPSIIAAEH